MARVRTRALTSLAAALVLGACGGKGSVSGPPPSAPNTIKVTSPAFRDGGTLPKQFTCDGKLGGVNPPLNWSNRPRDEKSQALIVEDPDAPGGTYVHWTAWRMMARTSGLQADVPPIGLPQGRNSAGRTGYAPPCPPKGDPPHRYQFIIYALNQPIDAKPGAPPDQVIGKIERAALARGTLTAKYGR
jgi:Raf kinase inhibitor-like YbhB/YbcL family protein